MSEQKCPKCGADLAENRKCQACGWKREDTAEQVADSVNAIENEEQKQQSETKPNKKIVAAVTIGAVAMAGVAVAFVVPRRSSSVEFTCDGWTYVETSDDKEMFGTIHTKSKKNLLLCTESGNRFVVRNGECNIKERVDKEKKEDRIVAVYEIRDPKDIEAKIDVDELKTDVVETNTDDNDISVETTVRTDSKTPIMLLYHYEDENGDIRESSKDSYITIENGEEDISSTWQAPGNPKYTIVIDGAVDFRGIKEKGDIEATYGKPTKEFKSSIFFLTQPVELNEEKPGIFWSEIYADEKDNGSTYCNIYQGEGTLTWIHYSSDQTEAPENVVLEPAYFAPSEYRTGTVLNFSEAQKRLPTLEEVGERYAWSTLDTIVLADDGSYLKVDTNPFDIESGDMASIIWDDIVDINKMLGLPESLNEKMATTRGLDGRQSAEYDNVEVTWSYHPDSGLEILYEDKIGRTGDQ